MNTKVTDVAGGGDDRVKAALKSLERLREGNLRFVAGTPQLSAGPALEERAGLVEGQEPFAVVLGCSDSRVPPEIVFDQGLGELFTIRVAGNVAAPTVIGSIEFAAERLGVKLIVVLGHTRCGAIQATLQTLRKQAEASKAGSGDLLSIVDRIRPSVEPMLDAELGYDPETVVSRAVRANVRRSADELHRGSPVLERLIRDEGGLLVGAEYALETGVVDFFHGVP